MECIVNQLGKILSNTLLKLVKPIARDILKGGVSVIFNHTDFSWCSMLTPNSIHTWFHLKKKFNEHFFTRENKLKLSHLTLV
jgi:hypothetical protein